MICGSRLDLMKNHSAMEEYWNKLMSRAKELAVRQSDTGELLTFYWKLLGVQKQVYEYLAGKKDFRLSGLFAQDLIVVQTMMPPLLEVVKTTGPAALADEAERLLQATEDEINQMLTEYWMAPTDVQFFAKALLQPYACRLVEIGAKPPDRNLGTGENRCPFCAGKPQVAVLKTHDLDSDVGSRHLLCSTCFTVWPFRRVVCANCGEERPAQLGYFHTDEYDHARAEFCDSCKHYIKSIDLMKLGLAMPLVDEVAAAPLDVWAHERGYMKIELNLVGL
jgi:formate dehydrogenase accessory protein FdhE